MCSVHIQSKLLLRTPITLSEQEENRGGYKCVCVLGGGGLPELTGTSSPTEVGSRRRVV